jgi:outer membrane protein OmpA-like peptidoglycan-associated protein/tetratricopeptide (TPR) repeat protein
MKNFLLICIFSTIASFSSIAQNAKLKKANDYYEKLSYALAIEVYKDLLSSDLANAEMKAKLAHSYLNVNDLSLSEKYYNEALKLGALPTEHYFYFSQTLKQLGKYSESDKWMNTFYEKSNLDKRAISFANNRSYLDKIEKEGFHFTVSNATFNSNTSDFGGYQSVKKGEVYFVSARRNTLVQNNWMWNGRGFLDLFSIDLNEKESPELASKANTSFHEGPLCFNKDESIVYFTRNNISKGKNRRDNKGIQNLKLYVAKVDKNGKWSEIKELGINSKDYSVGHPVVSLDGKSLFFASDMPGGMGGADLYRAPINEDGSVGTPINLGKDINTEGQEMFPWISPDGLFFFSSNGHVGLGGLDVFVMTMDEKSFSFDNLTNVGRPMNSQNDDFAISFNQDGKTGYFSSNRADGKGDDDIYAFTLTKPFIFKVKLTITVADNNTNQILPDSKVYLKDEAGNIIQTAVVDVNGKVTFEIEPKKSYNITASKNEYTDNVASILIDNLTSNTIDATVKLDKMKGVSLYGLISDKNTKELIQDATVSIIDKNTGRVVFEGNTSKEGDFSKALENVKVNETLNYTVAIKKEGYLSKTVDFSTLIKTLDVVNLNDNLDVSLTKIEVGSDLAKLVDVKPIYFDKSKYNIRKDAALELDKIVKIMNDYPTMIIELGSHTDCRGSIEQNQTLSDNRAKASANYIKSKITNPERISGLGYGEAKLVSDCPCEGTVKSTCSEDEHQKNRRTEFIIIKL